MKHVIVCPEYPPAPIPAGGIGTYVHNISRLLASAGDTVHVISVLWHGAPIAREELCDGRLIIHRISLDQPLDVPWNRERSSLAQDEVSYLASSSFSSHCFAWQASLFTERLIETEGIDVIESQEYHAPLYYLQLRRTLGLGPSRRPPFIVHLHSPTELIVRANDWNDSEPWFVTAKRMESFSITSADAWMCPSRYLARQAENIYGLRADAIEVIPLPMGATALLQRGADVWQDGTICYVGRLEPRKGIIEWVDAAVAAADDYPSARFELIGADLPYSGGRSVLEHVQESIPERLKWRFTFRGQVERSQLPEHLRRARIAVIPSRWENFPNTCVEAMGSGLPVLATRQGGMAEMVEDAYSGWLTDAPGPRGLERALRRALDTPSLDICTMGRNAARAIRNICDDDAVLERHIEFRERVAAAGAGEARLSPVASNGFRSSVPRIAPHGTKWHGTALVIAVVGDPHALAECLERVEALTRAPREVLIVMDDQRDRETRLVAERLRASGRAVVTARGTRLAELWNAGIEAAAPTDVSAFVLMDERDRLLPGFLAGLEDAARQCSTVGVMSCWTKTPEGVAMPPVTTFPSELLRNEIQTPVLVRSQALQDERFRAEMGNAHALWDFVIAVMSRGWGAAVYPGLLSERFVGRHEELEPAARRMRHAMLERVGRIVSEFAVELVELVEDSAPARPTNRKTSETTERGMPKILRPRDILRLPVRQQLRLARMAAARPRDASRFLMWHTRAALKRLASGVRPSGGQ